LDPLVGVGFFGNGRSHFRSRGQPGIWHDSNEHSLFARDDFTPNRDRAKLIGFFFHFANGWIFALVYVAAFHAFGVATWWFGAIIGLVQATFVLTMLMPILPALHPRMANEQYGPTVVHQLEPPGFLGLHYGWRTPISVLIAHTIFGAILGAFYVVR